MTKSAYISMCADPFIATLSLKMFKMYWRDEVDRVYINYNNYGDVPVSPRQEFLHYASGLDPKIQIIYHPYGIGNGAPITEMAKIAKEDLVLLLEDDGYIFKSGEVSKAFALIENGSADAVGSPRFSCGLEIAEALRLKYNLDYSGYGDAGPNYWPNFFFCKREDLLKTDMNFGSKEFTKGVYYKELDHTMSETEGGDTFVWAGVQMRYNGVRFAHIPQYHASPEEVAFFQARTDKWASPFGWIHAGSLSAGWSGYLVGNIPDTSTPLAKMEIETRVAFWKLAVDTTEGYTEFREKYLWGLSELVINANLDRQRIERKYKIYKQLLKLW